MKKIILIFAVLFLCFGFSDMERLENSSIEENCCSSETMETYNLPVRKVAPGYELLKMNKQRIIENKTSLLLQIKVEKGTDYMLRYEFHNKGRLIKNTGGLFVVNYENDTLVRTLLNGKSYDGFTYKADKNETLRVYINPYENPLLLKKHKKRDKCATVRCIEYTIGTRKR